MEELAALTDKLTVEISNDGTDAPCVRVCRADGSWTGLAFHGVPGGHEFTSFVLGLYNAAGPGQAVDADVLEGTRAITQKTDVKVLVSLSCTMCPDTVVAAQQIAAKNKNVTAEVYDVHHFEALRKQYNVMSVPCIVINDTDVAFGKKNISQLLELIG
jgi:thioredoxin reductase (NADPH)